MVRLFDPTTSEFTSSIPCEYLSNDKLLCQQTSFTQANLPFTNNPTNYSQITHLEWIESGAYILSHHIFDSFYNLKNVSLRSNTLTSLTVLPFWSLLKNISHLDLSQNRLISLYNRDFQSFHHLISLNISLNFLTTVEPIWLFLPLQILDLSNNGINSLGNIKLQNSTPEFPLCLIKHIYLNHNRGLLSFSQFQTTIMDYCPFIERFQLINNHWHCSCSDLVHSLKHYRTLNLLDDSSQTLTGQCETPLSLRHIDIEKMTEELVCDRLVLFDSILNDDSSQTSFFFSRHIIFLFLIGCLIGFLIGLCLHYCAHRCYDLIYLILYKCDREKMANDRTSNESSSMNETNLNSEQFIYYPRTEIDQLPSYSQVMNDIFYLDILTRRSTNEHDGEC